MKKFLTLLLVLALIVSMVAMVSCKDKTPDDPVDPDTPVDPDPVDPDPVDPDPVDPDPVDPDPVDPDPVDPDPVDPDPVDPDPVDPDPVDPDPVDPDPVDPDPVDPDPVDPDPVDPDPVDPDPVIVDPIVIATTNEKAEKALSKSSPHGKLQWNVAGNGAPVDITMMTTLELEVYISDVAAGELQFCIELGSAGKCDHNERSVITSLNDLAGDNTLTTGWNHLSIALSRFTKSASADADLSAWNWFRIYNQKCGDDTTEYTVKFKFAYLSMNGASLEAPAEPVEVPVIPSVEDSQTDPTVIGPEGITLPPDETVADQ